MLDGSKTNIVTSVEVELKFISPFLKQKHDMHTSSSTYVEMSYS